MTARLAYDATLDPPGPVVPVRISAPAGQDSVMLPMLVDTGADCTLVPAALVRQLGLPPIDVIAVTGVGGARRRATVHAAALELGGLRLVARVVGFDEAILGRDVLNHTVITLDGPGRAISVTGRARTRRPRRPRRPRRMT